MATIHVRTDDKLKKDANKVFKGMGIDMSNGIKLFLKQVVVTKSIPFPIKTGNGFTAKEEAEMLKDSEKMKEDYKKGKAKTFSSAAEMFEDIFK